MGVTILGLTSPANSTGFLHNDGAGVLAWQAAGGGGISGSGTTNYLSKFTGTSAIGNSQIFDDGTNLGIGTITPNYKLDIELPDGTSDGLLLGVGVGSSPSSNSRIFIAMQRGSGVNGLWQQAINQDRVDNNDLSWRSRGENAGYTLRLSSHISASQDNRVCIGSPVSDTYLTAPLASLDVRGFDNTSSNYGFMVGNTSGLGNHGITFSIKNNGNIAMPLVQTGNAGLASGDLYFDTAANALANGDKILIRKT